MLDEAEGKRSDAIPRLEKVIVSDPKNEDAFLRLWRLYRGLHMTAAADALASKYKVRFGKTLPQ